MECDPACCPCAAECANQVMQQRLAPKARYPGELTAAFPSFNGQYANRKGVECRRIHMGEKGWGIVADEDILPGTFVMEYIGAKAGWDQLFLPWQRVVSSKQTSFVLMPCRRGDRP